jgi:hypothetical protein
MRLCHCKRMSSGEAFARRFWHKIDTSEVAGPGAAPPPSIAKLVSLSHLFSALVSSHSTNLHNIFLIYMPPGNAEAMAHYEDTIKRKVTLDRVAPYLTRNEVSRLRGLFGDRRLAIWGSRNSTANRAKFERMSPGDDLLIVEGHRVRFVGKIALRTVNAALSRELWQQFQEASVSGWELIYFVANPLELDISFSSFAQLAGFEHGFQLRGFTRLATERATTLFAKYGDLYSVLLRLQQNQPVLEKTVEEMDAPALVEVAPEEISAVLQSPIRTQGGGEGMGSCTRPAETAHSIRLQ